jgi:hypothetical protein
VTAQELVTVRRHRDPLDGQTLPVLGRCRRGTQLLVVLPDGSKRVIPAAWTDEGAGAAAAALASAGDLLRLCALVSAFSDRRGGDQEQAARQSPSKEDSHAARTAQSAAGPGSGATPGHDRPAPRRAGRRGDPDTRQPDRQPAGPCAGSGGRR